MLEKVQASVIRLIVEGVESNFYEPYKIGNMVATTSSATIINIADKKYILTNYHCVNIKKSIVRGIKYNSPKLFDLNIVCTAPELDLALLTSSDEFYEGLTGLIINKPPKVSDKIYVIGYPRGGSSVSITKGVFSRWEAVKLNNGPYQFCMQVDAGINPGNSGGLAMLKDGSFIGVPFAHGVNANNIGFLLPYRIVQLFIRAFTSKHEFTGIGDLGLYTDEMFNKQMQKYYGADENHNGVFVVEVFPTGTCGHLLKREDIIVSIDNLKINFDGLIGIDNKGEFCNLDNENLIGRANFNHYIRGQKLPGDEIILTYIRNRESKTIKLILDKFKQPVLPTMDYYISLDYYIYAGLIFIIGNNTYVFESDSNNLDNSKLSLFKYIAKMPKFEGQQIVVLHTIITTEFTAGYSTNPKRLIKVNDMKIENLNHLIKICEMEVNDKFMKFELETGEIIITKRVSPETLENIAKERIGIPYKRCTEF